MSSSRRQYHREFKLSAVRLWEESGKTVSEVARSLGICETLIRKWRKQIRERGAESFDESGRQERSELLRLQRENKDLRRDLEMLKKTLGYLKKAKR
jgi:transposase